MKHLFLTMVFSVSILGCKQGVEFGPGNEGEDGQDPFTEEPLGGYDGLTIVFTERPQDTIEGQDVEAVFRVIAGTFPIASVRCTVDEIVVPCDAEGDTISVIAPALGTHRIMVTAVDAGEVITRKEAEFTIHDQMSRHVQALNIAPLQKRKTDILFVIDNSGSMSQEQANMAERILSFMELLDNLDWRVAISTTDPRSSVSYGDGVLLPFSNGSYYLESSMDLAVAKALFAETIQRDEYGSGYERGIRSLYRTIERKNAGDVEPAAFFRTEAVLSVIVVSDEDETFYDGGGNLFADSNKSESSGLMSLIQSTWGGEKLFQFSSIITRPDDAQCLQPVGTGYAYGHLLEELSLSTGGVVGDICAADFGLQLAEIGQGISDLETVYELACVPQDLNRDGEINFDVQNLDGQTVPGYSISGTKVTFDEPLQEGDYNFVYFCLNTVSE